MSEDAADIEAADLAYVWHRLTDRHDQATADAVLDDARVRTRVVHAYRTEARLLAAGQLPGRSLILYERLWADAAVRSDARVEIDLQQVAQELHTTERTVERWIKRMQHAGVVERVGRSRPMTLRVTVLLQAPQGHTTSSLPS